MKRQKNIFFGGRWWSRLLKLKQTCGRTTARNVYFVYIFLFSFGFFFNGRYENSWFLFFSCDGTFFFSCSFFSKNQKKSWGIKCCTLFFALFFIY